MNEIKPCPHCNTIPETTGRISSDKKDRIVQFQIKCERCGLTVIESMIAPHGGTNLSMDNVIDVAIEEWNKQTEEEPIITERKDKR